MKYLLMLVLYTSNILANEQIISTLNFLNMFNSGDQFQRPSSCSLENFQISNAKVSELNHKCAIDLCGKPKNSQSPALLNFNFDQYVQEGAMKRFEEIEQQIKEMIESEFQKNTNFLSAVGDKIKGSGGLKPDYDQWEDWDYDTYTWKFFDKYVEFETDKTKPFNERLTYTFKLPKDATDVFKSGIKEYAEYKKKEKQTSFSSGIYGDFYTIEEAKKILREKFENFEEKYLDEKKLKPDFMKDKIEDYEKIKDKISKDDFEDIYAIGNVANDLYNLNNEMIFQQTGSWPNSTSSYSCSGSACKKAIQEQIGKQDFSKLYSEIKAKNSEKDKRFQEKITYCKSEFAMKSLKDYEKESFKKLIPEIKENFLKNVFKNYSSDSKAKFNDYMENDLNLSTESKKQDLQEYIDRIKDNYKSFKENTTPDDYKNYDTKQFMRKLLLDYQTYTGEIDPLRNMSPCNDSLSYVVWDGFVPKEEASGLGEMGEDLDPEKDNILISMFTCTHHSHGKGILAHELGHALSWAFSQGKLSNESYGKFKQLRQCANTLYKVDANENKPIIIEHEGDLYRTEEDTADLISYIANTDKSLLFECALLEPSSDGETYENPELSNSIDMGTHSAPLLRVLQEAIHKRKEIPATCQELINQNKDKFRFEPCF